VEQRKLHYGSWFHGYSYCMLVITSYRSMDHCFRSGIDHGCCWRRRWLETARESGEIEQIRFPGRADEYARKAGRSASSPSWTSRKSRSLVGAMI
jgi:hypothetical protein